MTSISFFELGVEDAGKGREFYGAMFGWEFETPSPVAKEVSEQGSYGFLDLVTSEEVFLGSQVRALPSIVR